MFIQYKAIYYLSLYFIIKLLYQKVALWLKHYEDSKMHMTCIIHTACMKVFMCNSYMHIYIQINVSYDCAKYTHTYIMET